MIGSVQQKISCVFETTVLDEKSSKRDNQSYRVVATEKFKQRAVDSDIHCAVATEKLDGTCVYFAKFEDKVWLWARYDRKPTKGAEKRFKKFQQQKQKQQGSGEGKDSAPKFKWDLEKDFKETPDYWIPALGIEVVDGFPVPDDIGHTPGWVPVSPASRQQCWHLSAVDLTNGLALVLREEEDGDGLCIACVELSELEGCTAELIGTNINGNPYGLGSKKFPIHVYVVHGSIKIRNPPVVQCDSLTNWFQTEGQVEGIVWHCANGSLFKLHRNHVAISWPVPEPTLTLRRVIVTVDTTKYELEDEKSLIGRFGKICGQSCESLKHLEYLLTADMDKGNTTVVENGIPAESQPTAEQS